MINPIVTYDDALSCFQIFHHGDRNSIPACKRVSFSFVRYVHVLYSRLSTLFSSVSYDIYIRIYLSSFTVLKEVL